MKEAQQLEWKESWRDEYLRWICGFANAEGGMLVIGRNDKGQAVGVKDARKLLVDIPNKVRDILGIMVKVKLQEEAGRDLVEIVVDPYPYPVSYRGEYHIRSGSTKQELKGAALDKFLLRKQGKHWDGVPIPGVAWNALRAGALAQFRKGAGKSKRLSLEVLQEPDDALLEKLHLMEGVHLKRAAVLLFHPEPEHFVTGAYIKIGYFESNVDLRYQDEVQGDLFAQASRTFDLLRTKYLKALVTYSGLQRTESYPVPDGALREAILNAIVHKDYASGVPTQISVYPDKLMIWNPGQLPPDWTVARCLGKHASQPFNPDVANAFFRAGMIEAWGRGIERILVACREARVTEPIMECDASGFWIKFPFALAHVAAMPVTERETPVETPVKTPARILHLLWANPHLTLAEVAEAVGKSLRTVERATAGLVRDGKLRYVGPQRGGHWEVLK
ncbi:MAG: winged helix-turn-helix transcriptional regulator [Thermoanaerobaculia bacterium]|nr:winged helix-turn-helix transcriptional regulator [Thermoanaerobaculia bacterium]